MNDTRRNSFWSLKHTGTCYTWCTSQMFSLCIPLFCTVMHSLPPPSLANGGPHIFWHYLPLSSHLPPLSGPPPPHLQAGLNLNLLPQFLVKSSLPHLALCCLMYYKWRLVRPDVHYKGHCINVCFDRVKITMTFLKILKSGSQDFHFQEKKSFLATKTWYLQKIADLPLLLP